MSELKAEGWLCPHNSKKWHYFTGMKSLCCKWMVLTHPREGYKGDVDSEDNCAECARRRAKQISKERAVAAGEGE